jgi:hypothetical protein
MVSLQSALDARDRLSNDALNALSKVKEIARQIDILINNYRT